jgi:hypothetical protein
MSDPLDRMMTAVIEQRDALAVRLNAAELLLQEAEYVIELLLGDGYNEQAHQVLTAIEQHWQQYPDPEAP